MYDDMKRAFTAIRLPNIALPAWIPVLDILPAVMILFVFIFKYNRLRRILGQILSGNLMSARTPCGHKALIYKGLTVSRR